MEAILVGRKEGPANIPGLPRCRKRTPGGASRFRRAALLLAALAALVTGFVTPKPTRILFIGNSHTYMHDVPAKVAAVLALYGRGEVELRTVALPNFALEDHVTDGTATALLRAERWDFVVLQQGASAQPASQAHLAHWVTTLAPLIRSAGAVPVLYQVWPLRSRPADLAGVDKGYRASALKVGGLYAPAGNAWFALGKGSAPAELYDPDGLHASERGAWLAALVIASRIAGKDPATLTGFSRASGLGDATARAFQAAAHEALEVEEITTADTAS
jgi:hypothetical protein